jgi:hypothetical protein
MIIGESGASISHLQILATQEAETRRISVQSQPQANHLWDPPHLKYTHTQHNKTKKAGGLAQERLPKYGPEFKPQWHQKKKKFIGNYRLTNTWNYLIFDF